jgi:hypothetical protein
MLALPRVKRDRGAGAGRRPTLLLAAGALLGIGIAAYEVLAPAASRDALPPGAVAVVNGEPISRDDYERAVAGLATERRDSGRDDDRARVLQRLIEEELLVQRGLELGLVRRDSRVRADLVAAVIDVVTGQAAAAAPSREEMERFYAEHRDYFAGTGRVRVRQILVRVPPEGDDAGALARAAQATSRLRAGEDFAAVAAALGDAEVAPLPDAPLPPAKLREYLGPTASRAALDLPVGQASDPVRSSQGYHVLEVVERDAGQAPPLAEIEEQVRGEMSRRAADQALRDSLNELREQAAVTIAPDAGEAKIP